ncbi:DnaB Replicative DNA helicase [uncultured Caudovirales phage]|uniref:DnaB-like replicative helicase n=1 Tax=uncultured Caudovirales phage TaxID=2100421 RepID=A0A6J7X045_9CAUD|nr:DnaB Replicative DNA helicase [uncultured Caudovirales phage]
MSIESAILSHLIFNEAFARKTLPFLKDEYFHNQHEKTVYKLVDAYVKKYNSPPTKEVLHIELNNKDGLSESIFKDSKQLIDNLAVENTDVAWLLDNTEKFCQEKAVYNAIMASIKILDDKTGSSSTGSIPTLLSDALGVSFDVSIGHDYFADADDRFDFYHRKEEHIPFDLDFFNKITKGGLVRKTLNIALAGTGVGKSLFMCHCAANNLTQGRNVLYITMEMAEEKIAERIDANLLNVTVDELSILPKDVYDKKISRLKEKTVGKLVIKEYPTASAGSGHFRHLLNELRIKRNFVPDIIYIDYLNICSSSRIKSGANVNSYTYIKAIAEELRGLAVEFNVPVVSATQTTRSGYGNSDVELTDTSESFGLPATADLMFGLVNTEELEQRGQLMVKQLKNRYNDPTMFKRFVIGVDRAKMRLYDVEQSAQTLTDDTPVFSKSNFGQADEERKAKLKKLMN